MFHITFSEAVEDFWRHFKAILSHEPISKSTVSHLIKYDIISIIEGYVINFQLPGEYYSDLVTSLLKMKTKFSARSRHKFQVFLEHSNAFNASSILLWNELGKDIKYFLLLSNSESMCSIHYYFVMMFGGLHVQQ